MIVSLLILFAFLARQAATDCQTSISVTQFNIPGTIYTTKTSLNVSIVNVANGSFTVDWDDGSNLDLHIISGIIISNFKKLIINS